MITYEWHDTFLNPNDLPDGKHIALIYIDDLYFFSQDSYTDFYTHKPLDGCIRAWKYIKPFAPNIKNYDEYASKVTRQMKDRQYRGNSMQNHKVVMPSDLDKSITKPGEVVVSNIHRPMKLGEFNRLDKSAKRVYIQWLKDTFNASDQVIADMLGCSQPMLSKQKNALGIQQENRHMTETERTAFEAFIHEKPVEPVAKEEKPSDHADLPKNDTWRDKAVEAIEALLADEYNRGFLNGYEKAKREMIALLQVGGLQP